MVQQILFLLVAITATWYAVRQFGKIRRNVLLGKEEDISGNPGLRWRNVLLVAFGQQKMFTNWIPGVLHLFIYVAFVITQIELIEIFADGLFGWHRFFAPRLGWLYTVIISFIEILSVLAFVATVIFLVRRNVLRVPRFHKPEMKGWPFLDANIILILEILLIVAIFSMNGADILLQQLNPYVYHDTGPLAVSSWLGPMLFGGLNESSLHFVERFGWWLHIGVVFGFLNYLPKSKHLHILLAFPNTYYARLTPRGKMENMPEVTKMVQGMFQPDTAEPPVEEEIPTFGAKDVFHLSWKNLLDAYSCTECGRCTASCPANLTGKKLSPRKIMMDIRDRTEEVGRKLDSKDPQYIREELRGEGVALSGENFGDGRSLFDYISPEEIHACTTCNACVEACPVLINPLEPILKMRRYEILMDSKGPTDWVPMFNSIENGGSPWQMPVSRDHWVNGD
ncbi:MAG: (Fe-S)-binding protein [Saprospirales bacterium]|nr:(Fe-S)-binding protein [Saprospirales bacterium]